MIIPLTKVGVTKTASVIIALTVMVSVVAVGVVAQPNSQNTNSSGEDTEPNDTMANATPIEYEQDVVTTLSAGEEDWYAVDGHAGRELLADIRNLEHALDGSLQVDVLTASGTVVAESSPSDDDTAEYVMASNETHYIRVSESPATEANGSVVFEYRLNAEADDLDG